MGVSRSIDRVEVMFDDPTLVANAGLVLPAMLMTRLGLESLINSTVRLVGRVGGALPGRKILTRVATILAGGSHIDHADMLRAGATRRALGFRVMAPSTLRTFLRAFTFGHVRQLDKVTGEAFRRAWRAGAAVTIDLDSTICEVHGKKKHGAAYGYTWCWAITRYSRRAPTLARSSTRGCAMVGASLLPHVNSSGSGDSLPHRESPDGRAG